jgi:hypothetical protein
MNVELIKLTTQLIVIVSFTSNILYYQIRADAYFDSNDTKTKKKKIALLMTALLFKRALTFGNKVYLVQEKQ